MWAVRVEGDPITKGDLVCFGKDGRHHLSEQEKKGGKEWRRRVTTAGATLRTLTGRQLDGPVSLELTFTLASPKSVKGREWPHVFGSGDIDKLARMILDALSDGLVWRNDAQVVELTCRKAYPHTTAPDVHTAPAVLIRLWETET